MNGITLLEGDCRETLKTLPDGSVHCCVTSPPYYNLRDYGHDGQIGLEETPEQYVDQLVQVFREVRRVLRDDGTLWLNLGDSYASQGGSHAGRADQRGVGGKRVLDSGAGDSGNRVAPNGLKPKDLIGIPWRVAFALQADGWYLRQDIIWHKPNPMPESMTDRCTKAHEYIFLMTKSPRYYFDNEAIKEQGTGRPCGNTQPTKGAKAHANGDDKMRYARNLHKIEAAETRNRRSVWTVTTKPYSGAHFAVFPTDLIEPCILAGTSEVGCCPDCGSPWARVISKERKPTRPGNKTKIGRLGIHEESPYHSHKGVICGNRDPQRHCTVTETAGWEASCDCGTGVDSAVPCTVLDPFNGSGTTGEVARECGCQYIGCELNPEYVDLSKERLRQGNLLVSR